MVERWTGVSATLASFIFVGATVHHFIPFQVQYFLTALAHKFISFFNPYIDITIEEYTSESTTRSKGYSAAEAYLSGSCSQRAPRLKANLAKDTKRFLVTIDNQVDVTDEFRGTKIWWSSHRHIPITRTISGHPYQEVIWSYVLTFHRRQRKLVEDVYLPHILEEGGAILARNRERRLYTNNLRSLRSWSGSMKQAWCHVTFEHPATFGSLAMDPARKKDIMDDLDKFLNGKEYYAKIGRAWTRKYLLSGSPGTGKSTIIAAMANFMGYDVYVLDLTTARSMDELRRLVAETTRKSIIVVEGIDCLNGKTGNCNGKTKKIAGVTMGNPSNGFYEGGVSMKNEIEEESMSVTLLGFMNSLDGLWSGCSTERILVFKTDNENILSPAVRCVMDKYIRMTCCDFESFKILAENYLGIKVHSSFGRIEELLREVDVTLADVTNQLMRINSVENGVDECIRKMTIMLEVKKVGKQEESYQDNDM